MSATTELLLAESAEAVLVRAAAAAHPSETGGLLLGARSGQRPWVTHVLEVPSARPSPAHYVLPAGFTHPLIACARRVNRRLGYLGEWHVHPVDAGPSRTDSRTMRRLSSHAAKPPILLLARLTPGGYDLEGHVWSGVRHRRLTIIRTGDLPADPRSCG
ncbi:MAG: Mov34/MPN/PAD-1 family protein [Actinomycetota bacterium]|jgi:integrative and conjugative element protein (TIGR02256 family)|nr:Mov34/MPN/PAD-1 family protein [Actinomycetota bacterium]